MRLNRYAQATAPGYCAGCAHICESAVNLDIPISDIMRYCMYHHSYDDHETAFRLFNELPADAKANIQRADFNLAEEKCPQKLQIAKILKGAPYDLS